ncbi:MAG TPA: class I SAM-dependent methyltransferase [Phycisphaerae bacterium]|nr:class I SAM-dependent methyltransferase [Phycisphaerae bacterium]
MWGSSGGQFRWQCRLGIAGMDDSPSGKVQGTLQARDIHCAWEQSYRSAENGGFYEAAFDYIAKVLDAPAGCTFLDAGCGSCAHSVRLAKRGFRVEAIDVSDSALGMARSHVRASGLEDRIRLQRQNICALPFGRGTFDYILCWAVLMHIPDVEKAISELARVLRPGGAIVISEGNMKSLDSRILRLLRLILRKGKRISRRPAGLEYWTHTKAGEILTRHADIRWLMEAFGRKGFAVEKRVAGQFTELYVKLPSRALRKLVHGFNRLWFRYVRFPQSAFGNILILEKQAQCPSNEGGMGDTGVGTWVGNGAPR